MLNAELLPEAKSGGRYSTIGRTFSLSFSLSDNKSNPSSIKQQASLIKPQPLLHSSDS